VGFGESGVYGGVIVNYNNTNPTFAGTTATDPEGGAIAAPLDAPTVTAIGSLAVSTTYYLAYSYTAADGTETPLSPESSVTTTAAGTSRWIKAVLPIPPSGAVFYNVYAGTVSGSLKLQAANQRLSRVAFELHSYNSGGAVHSAGAAQSTVSGLQQAFDACVAGLKVDAPNGIYNTECPLIHRSNANIPAFVSGAAGVDQASGGVSSGRTYINYTGTLSGVELLVTTAPLAEWENLSFNDTNSKVKYGIAPADFGGQNYKAAFRNVVAVAMAAGGIAVYIDENSGNSTHEPDSQRFINCSLRGKAWGASVAGSQATNWDFERSTLMGGANFVADSADAGDLRVFGNTQTRVSYGLFPNRGEYGIYQSRTVGHPNAGNTSWVKLESVYSERYEANFQFYHSGADPGAVLITRDLYSLNNTGRPAYGFYTNSNSYFELDYPQKFEGYVYANQSQVSIKHSGPKANIDFRNTPATYYKQKTGSFNLEFDAPETTYYIRPIAFVDELGRVHKVGLSSLGGMELAPAAGTPIRLTGPTQIRGAEPTLSLIDTTASAKSLAIAVDANLAQLRELAGASGSLLVIDLENNRIGIRTASAAVPLHVIGAMRSGATDATNLNINDNSIWALSNGAASDLYLNYGGANTFLNATAGRVAIGTTVAPTSALQVVGLPVYANNAAAVAGGLTAGAFYRTGADPDPVCVVH
jgi:hypothetical protein